VPWWDSKHLPDWLVAVAAAIVGRLDIVRVGCELCLCTADHCQVPWWDSKHLPDWLVAVAAAIVGCLVGVAVGCLIYNFCCRRYEAHICIGLRIDSPTVLFKLTTLNIS